MTQFAIVGGTLWGNRGAEAMVVTTIGRMRERAPGAEFVLMSYYPGADRRLAAGSGIVVDNAKPLLLLALYMPFAFACWLFRLIGMRLPDAVLPRPVRRLRACTALFDVSGISFHDGRIGVLIYNVFCIWPALLLGVPVFHLSQARGPFNNPLNRILSKWFLNACRQSFARGRVTADFMRGLDLKQERWSEAADVAFSFRDGDSITTESPHELAGAIERLAKAKQDGREIVALSPSSVVLKKTAELGIDYVDLFAKAAAHLHANGRHVVVLPNATRAGGEGTRNNDIVVIADIRARLQARAPEAATAATWIEFDLNTDAIRSFIRQCALLVTSRFHAMVAGLALGTPTFVIGWSHKYQEVLEMFDCADDAIDFANVEANLMPAIDRMLTLQEDRRARLTAARAAVTAASLKQFDKAADMLSLPSTKAANTKMRALTE